jgi:mitotic-spindle organizing protein 1
MATPSSAGSASGDAEDVPVPDCLDPAKARETMDIIYEVSRILNTGLDRHTLSILVGLCEAGVNPEALAAVVKELRREGQALEVRKQQDNLASIYSHQRLNYQKPRRRSAIIPANCFSFLLSFRTLGSSHSLPPKIDELHRAEAGLISIEVRRVQSNSR